MPELNDVTTGSTIASQWGNDIRDRTIQRYADAAERTTEHPSPTQGDLSYLADTGDVDVFGPSGWQHVGPPAGAMQMWGAASPPNGWLLCNGQAVSRTTYAALFAEYGTTFGSGDGSTTFNLPDMRQRFPLGLAVSGTGATLGSAAGSIDHAHTINPPNTASTTGGGHDHGAITGTGGGHDHGGFTALNTADVPFEAGTSGGSAADDEHLHAISAHNGHDHSLGTHSGHTHDVDIGGFSSLNSNPPFLTVNFIVKT